MDPLTLLTVGPSVVRMIGGLFGGKTEEVANKVASFADTIKGQPAGEQQQAMKQMLDTLPPEAIVEIKKIANEAARIEAEREANRLNAETAQHAAAMETIRTEAVHGDEFVKHTRPKIARQSFWIGSMYVLVFELLRVYGEFKQVELPGADLSLAGALFAPCVWYITMRTGDAVTSIWGGKGKT